MVIGGDGSYMGAKRLTEMGFPCIGLPGTIDNDIKGTDYTIGYFTALGTVVEAIDRLRDTSSSHQRISIVEVMGRYCGDLTLAAAIAGGCEFVVVPEVEFSREDLVNEIKAGIAKGKKHAIVAITEHICDVDELAKYIETETKRETRATVLGHIQRGGSPAHMTVFWRPAWVRTLSNCCCRVTAAVAWVFRTKNWFTMTSLTLLKT